MTENMQHSISPIRQLLTHPGYLRWSIATQLLRLPALMAALAFVLVGTYVTGSLSTGGWMVTTYVICAMAFAVPVGRLLDKVGLRKGASVLLILTALTLCVLFAVALMKGSIILLLFLAGLAGVFPAGISTRPLLNHVVSDGLLASALALDATIVEFVVVIAPFLASTAAWLSPAFAILAMAIATSVAILFLRGLQLTDARAGQSRGSLGTPAKGTTSKSLWRNRRFLFWLVASVAFGQVMGTAETGALPLAIRMHGTVASAATLIAVVSLSSVLGGLAYAKYAHRIGGSATNRALLFLVCMVVGCCVLAYSGTSLMAGVAMFLLGACTAPLSTVQSQAADGEIPADRKSEGFSLLNSAHSLGYGLGGLALATLPLTWMLVAGGASAIAALVLAPFMLRDSAGIRRREGDLLVHEAVD